MEQIKNKIDFIWDEILKKQALEEYKRVFGDISLPQMSEEEFYKWWNANKGIPYSTYYYDVAYCFWDIKENI